MSYFSSTFKKQLTPKSTYKYIFTTHKVITNEIEARPFESISIQTLHNNSVIDYTISDEFENPNVLRAVFDQWLLDCSGCFVKSPTFEKFKYSSEFNAPADINKALPTCHWYPVKIELDVPVFKIHWAVLFQTLETPTSSDDKIQIDDGPELQIEEHTYTQESDGTRFITTKEGVRTEWLQELNDASLPLSESPALRLEVDYDEAQREKFRRRVREARIRAKLARYRAERLAQRYEERFGDYPDEDAEEAQTEAEQSDDE